MAEEYSRHVSKVVISQLAETAGFQAVQESAVDILADLMLRYIAQLGSASHSYAELAGRTDCNINDLVRDAFQRTSEGLARWPADKHLECCSCLLLRTWTSIWTFSEHMRRQG